MIYLSGSSSRRDVMICDGFIPELDEWNGKYSDFFSRVGRPIGMERSVSLMSRSRLAYSNPDKGSIVLEIGRIYTKIGLSREPAPRHVIKSTVEMKPYGAVQDIWDQKYINREELYLILCRFLQHIYLKCLMVNPKDYRVVVIESLLCPSHFRNTLARTLFNHFGVPHVAFIPSHLVCLFSIGQQTALVVDVGWKETTILPIYEGIPIVGAWQSTSCSAETVHITVKASIAERGTVKNTKTLEEKPVAALSLGDLIQANIEDIIVRTCFVRPHDCDKVPPSVNYPLSREHILTIHGHTRDNSAEALFEDEGEDHPLPVCILQALFKCASDCRRALSENILIVGSIASLPGFNYRLKHELELLTSDRCQVYSSTLGSLTFKFHQPPAHPSTVAWVGGSIFGSSEVAVLERAISKDKFNEMHNRLPDWSSCDPEQQEQLRPVPVRKLLPAAPMLKTSKSVHKSH